MNTITINHYGKRAFNFSVNNGRIKYDWINYVDEDGSDSTINIGAKEIISIDSSIKGKKTIFFN